MKTLGVTQASELLTVSSSTVYHLIHSQKLQAYKHQRQWKISLDSLHKYLMVQLKKRGEFLLNNHQIAESRKVFKEMLTLFPEWVEAANTRVKLGSIGQNISVNEFLNVEERPLDFELTQSDPKFKGWSLERDSFDPNEIIYSSEASSVRVEPSPDLEKITLMRLASMVVFRTKSHIICNYLEEGPMSQTD